MEEWKSYEELNALESFLDPHNAKICQVGTLFVLYQQWSQISKHLFQHITNLSTLAIEVSPVPHKIRQEAQSEHKIMKDR